MEMPTAMLGDGAQLINAKGERFMLRYNPPHAEKQIEKARMSLCIQKEIDEGRGLPDNSVIFDTTVLAPETLEGYVTHVRACATRAPIRRSRRRMSGRRRTAKMVASSSTIPVGPACRGFTPAANPRAVYTGASRLAGNGCSDTLVFGALAGRGAAADLFAPAARDWDNVIAASVDSLRARTQRVGSVVAADIKDIVRHVMPRAAGLWRHHDTLKDGLGRLHDCRRTAGESLAGGDVDAAIEAIELDHMIVTAGW
jgi:succinate dehydrogenase/fumarate reductase flavoprotein subunit